MDSRIPHNRPSLGQAEADAAARVINSGFVAPGPEVAAFEAELAAFLSVDPSQVVLVSSGSAALLLAMRSIPRAVQRVQLPVYGCSAPLDAAEMAHLDWDLVDSTSTSPAASWPAGPAVSGTFRISVDYFGLPAAIPDDCATVVLADAAQSFGAKADNVHTCLRGDIGVISFSPTKIMTVGGSGGALVGTDRDWLAAARDYLDWDSRSDSRRRFNLVLGDVAAAVGRVQLRRLPEFIAMRRSILSRYAAAGIPIMQPQAGATTSGYRAVVEWPSATRCVQRIRDLGIDAILPYTAEEMMGRGLEASPHALRWSGSLVSLPVFPDMSSAQVDRVIHAWGQVAETPLDEAVGP